MPGSVGQELLNVPFAEMVSKLATGIAKAQTELDLNSTKVAKFMAKTEVELPKIGDLDKTVPFKLISLGFFPGYYQFQEAKIEVKMAITMATSSEFEAEASGSVGYGPYCASVNASYSSKYEYKAEGSSLLSVRMAPAPAPVVLQSYMQAVVEMARKQVEAEIKAAEDKTVSVPS